MAEVPPVITSVNHFSLDAAFGINADTVTPFQSFATAFDANGDFLCAQEYDPGINYANSAMYCGGATPDIVTSLGIMLSTFGIVVNSKQPTKLDFTFEAGVQATLDIEGHQHDDNPHVVGTPLNTFDCSSIIPALSGVGVPVLIAVAGDTSPGNATLSMELEHIDKPGADGTHFEGQNMRCHITLSVDYVGQPASVTAGDWLNVILVKSNPNDDTPTASLTAEQWIDII